jgi:hypothetical protein
MQTQYITNIRTTTDHGQTTPWERAGCWGAPLGPLSATGRTSGGLPDADTNYPIAAAQRRARAIRPRTLAQHNSELAAAEALDASPFALPV